MGTITLSRKSLKYLLITSLFLLALSISYTKAFAATTPGSVGIEGTVPGPPPSSAPTITFPVNNSSITQLPVRVTGLCQTGLLIKVFKNGVFAGSAICQNGSYSIEIDLFVGRNELLARAYDELEQASPDSNMIVVEFPVSASLAGLNRISLSSAFAKRGASPGSTLTWPISLSGGVGPYAITIEWGDNTRSDIISREFPGSFDINHVYESAGIYNVLIRATDKNNEVAFLQLVGVGNGEIVANIAPDNAAKQGLIDKVWWPAVAIFIPLNLITFWLGRKYTLLALKRNLERK